MFLFILSLLYIFFLCLLLDNISLFDERRIFMNKTKSSLISPTFESTNGRKTLNLSFISTETGEIHHCLKMMKRTKNEKKENRLILENLEKRLENIETKIDIICDFLKINIEMDDNEELPISKEVNITSEYKLE